MNNTVKIILIIATFVACAVLGYFVMPSNESNTGIVVSPTEPGSGGGGGGESRVVPSPSGPSKKNAGQVVPDEEQPVDTTDTPVPNVEATPEIKSVAVGQRSSKLYKKIGFYFVVEAVVASNDPLVYELYEIGGTTAKYTSDNGRFADVYPVDGGKYLLKVVNGNTGDSAEREVAGFNKINKYSASELQEQLNADSQERLFYCHFDTERLKFDCEGIDPAEAPASLNALSSSRSANGWVLTVVGSPKYDKYNRITYFKVRVTE